MQVPFGWNSADYGHNTTVNGLTNDNLTNWGGGAAFADTFVEVAKTP